MERFTYRAADGEKLIIKDEIFSNWYCFSVKRKIIWSRGGKLGLLEEINCDGKIVLSYGSRYDIIISLILNSWREEFGIMWISSAGYCRSVSSFVAVNNTTGKEIIEYVPRTSLHNGSTNALYTFIYFLNLPSLLSSGRCVYEKDQPTWAEPREGNYIT